MIIGFDAKRAAQNKTGLGNYSRFIIQALSRYATENKYLLYTPNPRKAKLFGTITRESDTRICFPAKFVWKKFSSFWRIWGITSDIIQDKVTLFHGLSNELPLNIRKARKTRTIVTIHDLIFLRYPEYYHFIDRKIYAFKFRHACQISDRIIAISECTKRDIISFFNIPAEKIDVVYQGCDEAFKKETPCKIKDNLRQKYSLPDQFILYVGSIENRKNLLLLAKALKHLKQSIPVVAIGKRTPYAEEIENYLKENELDSQMKLLSGIPFDELPAFYQMASVFVYPSRFEGFGIPLLEALNSGIPAIGATGSCLEEAGGPSSIYINPDDDKALAKAIDLILTNETVRERMIRDGKEYARRFEAAELTKELQIVYQKTIES